MERENGRKGQLIKGMLDRYESPQARHIAQDNPSEIARQNGRSEHLLENAVLERQNGHNEEIDSVLFRLVHHSNRHLVMTYPNEISRSHNESDMFARYVPTENLFFPEIEASFPEDKWNDSAEAILKIDFYDGWRQIKRGRTVSYTPEFTKISIYAGFPDKIRAFSINYSAALPQPKKLVYSPPIPSAKWRSEKGLFTRPLESEDLQSFWKTAESVLEDVDPQYLRDLERTIKIISSHRLSVN